MFPSIRLDDARLILGSFGGFRSTRLPSRLVAIAAGARVLAARNDTPFPLSIIVSSNAGSTSVGFAPQRDPIPGVNVVTTKVGGGFSHTFTLRKYEELWASALVPITIKVTEARV